MALKRGSVFYPLLKEYADEKYRLFSCKLTPTLEPACVLGVRIPQLRALAKRLLKEEPEQVAAFLEDLPHYYYDENNLHALFLSAGKDFACTLQLLDAFLPHIDNWATCDIISPQVFGRHKAELTAYIRRLLLSEHEYTLRFAIGMLLKYYLDEAFRPEYLQWVATVSHDAYYVKMMTAWYFATALAKQYEATLPFIEQQVLSPWVHNKTITKAKESLRITAAQKARLEALRR